LFDVVPSNLCKIKLEEKIKNLFIFSS